MQPILVLGPPRSGSTWVSEVLASAPGAHLLHEPDSDPNMPFGLLAKAGLGRYPLLRPGDRADRYERLWRAALTPGSTSRAAPAAVPRVVLRRTTLGLRNEILFGADTRRAELVTRLLAMSARPVSPADGGRAIVKSVHSGLAAEFVVRMGDPIILVVRRNPLNGVASWLDLGWQHQRLTGSWEDERRLGEQLGAPPPPQGSSMEELQAWSFAALTRALDIAAERAENWTVVQHEDLCHDPVAGFEKLFAQMGLPWTDAVRRAIEQKNDRGSGYVTNRVAADEPNRWRDRLDSSQVAVISKTAARLSIDC